MLPALISAVGAIGGGLIQSGMERAAEQRSMEFSERMYNKQYADNLRFWQMQNNYNSPQAQMERFKAAGLNPNLIYGQGNAGNAGSISTPDIQRPEFRTAQVGNSVADGFSKLAQYLDYEIKAATIDNLKKQGDVLTEDALLRRAQSIATGVNTDRARFDLNFEKGLESVSADARREGLRAVKVQSDMALSANDRANILGTSSLVEAAERILSSRAARAVSVQQEKLFREQVRSVRADTELKQLDIELKRLGIMPNDPMYSRILARYLDDLPALKDKAVDTVKKAGVGYFDWLKKGGIFQHFKF